MSFLLPRPPPQLVELVSRDAGFEAVLKVRTSVGLRIAHYLGNFSEREDRGEVDVGALDAETGMIATLAHDGNEIKEGEELYVQVHAWRAAGAAAPEGNPP